VIAMLMQSDGLEAVALLLTRPVLVVFRFGDVIVRSDDGHLHFPPGARPGEKALMTSVIASHDRGVLQLRTGLGEPTSEAALRAYLGELWAKTRAHVTPSTARRPEEFDVPPDLRDRKWRTEANVRAIQLAAEKRPEDFTADDLKALASYSGWGGLSIEAVKKSLPADMVPETFGLIHEYYTPQGIADAIAGVLCSLLADVAGHDGIVRALEPSAGIGRLIRAFTPRQCLAL
jgi:hypothetical protein